MRVEYRPQLIERFRVILLHGNDAGLVERRADALTVQSAGSVTDPFRVATLGRDDPSIAAEVSASSLSGGGRVVRIRDCIDRSTPLLESATVARSRCLVIAMAGSLTARSKLREWADQASAVASVACEPPSSEMRRREIVEFVNSRHLKFEDGVFDQALARLPSNLDAAFGVLDLLALYVSDGHVGSADLNAVLSGDMDGSVTGVVNRVLRRDAAGAHDALNDAVRAGVSGVAVVRILGAELLRLTRILMDVERGSTVGDAMQRQRLFAKDPRRGAMESASRAWSTNTVRALIERVRRAELDCKQTGANEELVIGCLIDEAARTEAVQSAIRNPLDTIDGRARPIGRKSEIEH